MNSIIESLTDKPEILLVVILSSVLASIFVLLTRTLYYKFNDTSPSNRLFNHIKNSKEKCLVLQVRLRDKELKGEFVTPIPEYSTLSNQNINFEGRQITPYVLSAEDSSAVAMVLNVLGKVGRTDNIYISYIDKDYDKWENPMFLVGGNWKTNRVFENFKPFYIYENGKFIIRETKQSFSQKDSNDDLGLLEKVYNPKTKKPIWILMGMRGAGTAGAAYSLVRWWRIFGKLYGKKPFGLVVQFSDKDGWQDSSIISYYPNPKFIKKVIHLRTFIKLKQLIKKY